jgi:hypothetical protein
LVDGGGWFHFSIVKANVQKKFGIKKYFLKKNYSTFVKILKIMAAPKVKLTISEQIDRAKDGRTQRWIVAKLKESGIEMTEVDFSNKKSGVTFSPEELKVLSEILGTEITA